MTEVQFQEMLYLVDGNAGAIDVMSNLLKKYPSSLTSLITLLQRNNIRGSNIWIIYKLCNKNLDDFIHYSFDTYKPISELEM